MDCFARYGLSCRFSLGRFPRHNAINNIIYHHSLKLPRFLQGWNNLVFVALMGTIQKALPWFHHGPRGSISCVNTYCQSHQHRASQDPGGAATHAEVEKTRKYVCPPDPMYLFQPVAVETSGTVGPTSASFLRELGKCLKMATGEPS